MFLKNNKSLFCFKYIVILDIELYWNLKIKHKQYLFYNIITDNNFINSTNEYIYILIIQKRNSKSLKYNSNWYSNYIFQSILYLYHNYIKIDIAMKLIIFLYCNYNLIDIVINYNYILIMVLWILYFNRNQNILDIVINIIVLL